MTALTPAEKAAVVVLGLDEAVAVQVLQQMSEPDLRRLVEVIESLESVSQDSLLPVLLEFEELLRKPVVPSAGRDYLRQLTVNALGEEDANRVFAPPGVAFSAIDSIRKAPPAQLAELLQEEHPQVGTIVLAQLPRELAAGVLGELDPAKQIDIVQRMTRLEKIQESAAAIATESVAESLTSEAGFDPQAGAAFDGVSFAAGLLNALPQDLSENLLELAAERDEALVPMLREAMFTFEDLSRLDNRSMQMLMREVSSDKVVVALKTASEALREAFLSAVSSRAAETIREDLEMMAPRRLSEVEENQREIVNLAMELAAEGKITMPNGGEELV